MGRTGKERKKRRRPPITPRNSPTKKRFHHPNRKDEEKFAKLLGMDIQFDTDNVWLLTQALTTELPGEYKMFVNPDDEAYYVKFDLNTGQEVEVTYDHPLAPAYKEIFEKMLREQQDAQAKLAGINDEEEEEEEKDEDGGDKDDEEGGEDAPKKISLTAEQRKKVRLGKQDALLYYKKVLGDPEVDDIKPDENASKTYWDIHPDDVEDLADYMEIDLDTEKTLLWVARMAACVELPPGWTENGPDTDVAHLRAEITNSQEDEPAQCYTYEKWLCRNDRETALMSLEEHPSEEYYKEVIKSLREELQDRMEDSMGQDDDDDDQNFIPEYCDEEGKVYTFDYSTREKNFTGRVIDLEALQDRNYGGTGTGEGDESENMTEEELEQKAKEEAAKLEKEAEEEALNTSMARAKMTPFQRLVEKLSKKGLMEKQIVDFALLIDINPNNERSEFIWLIDQGLSKPMPGWVYRADPNGKWHYYTETSGTQGLEKQQSSSLKRNGNGKGEISGWEADMNASLAQDDKRQTSNSTSISRNIQSVWTHPRVKFYKNLHKKLRKKRRLENREELASKLLKESTDDHIRRKHRGRQSGGVGVAHMAPREGDEDLVTQPTVWSFEQKAKIPKKKTLKDGYEEYEEEALNDVNGEDSVKKRPNRPLHPGFANNNNNTDNDGDQQHVEQDGFLNEKEYIGENKDPFQSAQFDDEQHGKENPNKKRRKRPNNKPGEGRQGERRSRESSSGGGGFTGLMIDATSPNKNASTSNLVKDKSSDVLYMQPPKFGAMNNMIPKSTLEKHRSESVDQFLDEDEGNLNYERSKTVMGVHDERGHVEKKKKKKKKKKKNRPQKLERLYDEDSDEDFSLLDDEEIKAEMRNVNDTNSGGDGTTWSMSTNSKISLKPLGVGLPSKIEVESHPLEKIDTPDISRKRFQPAKLDVMEERHPLQLIESKLEQSGKKKKSSFNGVPLGQGSLLNNNNNNASSLGALGLGSGANGLLGGGGMSGNNFNNNNNNNIQSMGNLRSSGQSLLKKPAFGKNMLGNVMQEEEPYKIPSPREKRKRFQPAFNAMAPLGGGGGGLGGRGLGGNGGGLMKL